MPGMRVVPRFSLRFVFALMAIVSVLMAWIVSRVDWIRQRHEWVECYGVSKMGYPYFPAKEVPWQLRLFGEGAVESVNAPITKIEFAQKLFPEARVWANVPSLTGLKVGMT